MSKKGKISNLLIHIFAFAHALTALLLFSTSMGDEIPLTLLTIVMIIAVSRIYESPLEVSAALALLGCFAGFYLGTKGLTLMIFIEPHLGAYANVITTFIVTEILGWVTYIVVKPKKIVR